MLLLFTVLTAAGVVAGAEVRFEKIVIDVDSKGEAAAVMDVNRSGKLSIVCGESWYEPTDKTLRQWKKHPLRKIEYKLEYFDDFANLVLDVNGDGYPDIISGGFFSGKTFWYENPGKAGGEWKEHPIDTRGIETARLWDVAGDGQLTLVPNSPGSPVNWYELKRDAAGKGTGEFIKHTAYDKPFMGEGIGFGDINGDGRGDFVTSMGWVEAPADRRGPWIVHEEFKLTGHQGVPIFVHDVNGDGAADLIYGMGHDYGLFWLEQKRAADGTRQWVRHTIDLRWSQAHALAMGDLDGDGRPELVAGKRYRAHGDSDPGGKDPCCLYYYSFDKTGTFTRHTIDEGNKVGVGVDVLVTDINGDGRLDIVCPGKGGLYLFLNQGVGAVATKPVVSEEEAKLIAVLKSSATFAEKSAACRDLARVGTSESVMVLSELLTDPQLSHMARYALEGIPGGASEAALRNALGNVKGQLLAGVITSIAARGERWAWPQLMSLLKDSDPQVVKAAALASGRLAYPLPVKVMQDTLKRGAKEPTRSALVAGLLAAGDTLLTKRQFKEALAIFDALRAGKLAPHERVTAWRGAILANKADGVALILEALRGTDVSAFHGALRAIDEMPDPKVTKALEDEVSKLSFDRQAILCKALGRRQRASSLPALLALAKSSTKPVRLVAIGAIGQIGDVAALAPLMELLQGADEDTTVAVLTALASLPEAQVNERILKCLETPATANRHILLTLAGERRIAKALPILSKELTNPDAAIRKAAIKGYGETAGEGELPRVLELLSTTKDAEELDVVEKVLVSISTAANDPNAVVQKLASAKANAGGEAKKVLLHTASAVGNAAALEMVRDATSSSDKEGRLEAIRVLSSWKTADAAPLLLEIAKTADNPTVKLVSLRGYIWMANRSTLPREQRVQVCRTAVPLVDRTDLRRILLSVMTTLPDPTLFEVMMPLLDDPAVRKESLATMTKLVAWTGKRQAPLARAALEKLLQVAANDADTVKQAQELLNKVNAIK